MQSIFLAHSSINKRFTRRLANHLREHGIRVWFDEAEIQIGDSLIGKIESAINEMDYLGVILSPHSVNSEWVRREVEIAMTQEINGKMIKVLPILWRSCSIPGFLQGKVYANLSTPARYKKDFSRLVRKLTRQEDADTHLRDIIPQQISVHSLDESFAKELFLNLSEERNKLAFRHVFSCIAEGWIYMGRVCLENSKVRIQCRIPKNIVGQDEEVEGIQIRKVDAKVLFALLPNDELYLAPTGQKVLQLLNEWFNDNADKYNCD